MRHQEINKMFYLGGICVKKIEHEVFGALEFDYLWEGNKIVDFYKRKKNVIIAVDGEENANFEQSQIDSYIKFFENQKQYLLEAEEKIFEYYQKICLEYRNMLGELADKFVPIVSRKEDMQGLVELEQITFPEPYGEEERVVGLLLNCSWEPEHGLGVKFLNEKIVEVGFQDIVL